MKDLQEKAARRAMRRKLDRVLRSWIAELARGTEDVWRRVRARLDQAPVKDATEK